MRLLWLLIPFVPKGGIRFRTVDKDDSLLMKAFAIILWPMLRGRFMASFYTTVGETIYGPRGSSHQNPTVIAHEKIHIEQLHFWGILYWVLYVLALPIGFNPWRTYWEAQAYLKTGTSKETVIKHLSGPSYGWAMPAPILRALL